MLGFTQLIASLRKKNLIFLNFILFEVKKILLNRFYQIKKEFLIWNLKTSFFIDEHKFHNFLINSKLSFFPPLKKNLARNPLKK
jgi:hypothetical protein